MESIDEYIRLSEDATSAEFCQRMPAFVLLKRARRSEKQPTGISSTFSFTTQQAEISRDPLATLWQVLPVQKKAGNPFPERLSVGRASNCDLVIRLPFISKLHAHILLNADGTMRVRANRTSNITAVNRVELAEGDERPLAEGDLLSLGALELELLRAASFYVLLRSGEIEAARR